MDVSVPAEFGLDAYKDNIGSMLNRGVEVVLSYNNNWGDWRFGATANFSYNKNELLDLGGVESMPDPNNSNRYRKIGERINSYYMYQTDGLFDSDEAAKAWMDKYAGKDGYPFGTAEFKGGDVVVKDMNGDGKITADDRAFCGSIDPSWTYAAVWLDAWTPENKDAKMPRIAYDTTSPSLNYATDYFLQNTSYLRMKNVQFGYTFPKKWMDRLGVQNLRIYYSAENLFTIHNMLVDFDPETKVERGSNYPLSKTHSFGINLTF